MLLPDLKVPALVGMASLVIGLAAGAWINGDRWGAKYNALVAKQASDAAKAADDTTKAIEQVRIDNAQARLELLRRLSDANDMLETVQAANDKYARCVAAGTCGMRVAAHCPTVPAAQGSGSSDTAAGTAGGSAELDPTARPYYFALRNGLAVQYALLIKCRDYAQSTLRR